MGSLFDGYGKGRSGPLAAAFDEVVDREGQVRKSYEQVVEAISVLDPEDISARAGRLARAFMDQGVTFDLDGEERPFPLDVVPRIFSTAEWATISQGVAQRVRALEAAMSNALLSRVAESIFWVGRYVERAEGTARILDVVVYQALEQSGDTGAAASQRLLAVMGLQPDAEATTLWQVTERLARDPASRSSIAGAMGAARENAAAVRHVIPVELWERINATWSDLPHQWEKGLSG